MRLVVRAGDRSNPATWEWIESRAGCALMPDSRFVEAVDSSGRTRGMVAYERWTENAVQAHMAADSPIVWRSLLGPAFAYPFEECGKGLLLAVIPASNAKSVRMTQHLGFRETHRIRDGWVRGDDLVLFEMTHAECPHLEARNG